MPAKYPIYVYLDNYGDQRWFCLEHLELGQFVKVDAVKEISVRGNKLVDLDLPQAAARGPLQRGANPSVGFTRIRRVWASDNRITQVVARSRTCVGFDWHFPIVHVGQCRQPPDS